MSVLEFIKVVILGIIEGITEWLPISSTGHMILVDEFIKMDMTTEFKDFFLVVIQLGAILAVVVLYWGKLWPFYIRQIPKKKKAQLARKLRVQLLVFVTHVVLLFLIARKNANLADIAVQKVLEHRVAKTACAARDKQRFSLEKFCVHGLAKLLTS